jgi:signal transduction histidine kinase
LHAILAGVELLQDSKLTPFQEEMSLSVALAGRTLLDTVNHVLDYSKISNLTRGQKRDRAKVDVARHKSAAVEEDHKDPSIVVDLARITEEVVESVVSAYRFSKSFERGGSKPPEEDQKSVSVILDIDKHDSWSTTMQPGTWTRVLTNIGKWNPLFPGRYSYMVHCLASRSIKRTVLTCSTVGNAL